MSILERKLFEIHCDFPRCVEYVVSFEGRTEVENFAQELNWLRLVFGTVLHHYCPMHSTAAPKAS